MNKRLNCIVLAAGEGKRMKSAFPKVLHPVAGIPLLKRVLDAVHEVGCMEVRVVVSGKSITLQEFVKNSGDLPFIQESPTGTADAVKCASVDNLEGDVMIMCGDLPLVNSKDLIDAYEKFKKSGSTVGVVTAQLEEPGQLGRIVREMNRIRAIVEAKDASHYTLEIKEVNTGIYFVDSNFLVEFLNQVSNKNAQNEYYLTDIIEYGIERRMQVIAIDGDPRMATGVNDQKELAEATIRAFEIKNNLLMENGVTVMVPHQTFVTDEVKVAAGTVIFPGVFIRGKTKIGKNVVIEPNCFITDCTIGDDCILKAGSYLEGANIGNEVNIGPYARIRPETSVGDKAKIGNFVELKKVKFGRGAKASHLAYLGDAEVGEEANFGCGAITVNYREDKKKYKTLIGKNAFIGSDVSLIAPIKIGDGAIVGAGSAITKDVPNGALSVARGKQIVKENFKPKTVKS